MNEPKRAADVHFCVHISPDAHNHINYFLSPQIDNKMDLD